MMKMGRKSKAQKIIEELPKQDSFDKTYLMLYDFLGGPPKPVFYSNLHRITDLTENGSSLIQYSCYKTTSAKAVLAIQTLASKEGAETIIYEVKETSPEKILEQLKVAQIENEPED